jgi:glutamate N-acetyltransferase/amino-acid N-acetyltransferase
MPENKFKFVVNGSVTSPVGFKAAGITAGLKRSGKPDMALIVSDVPATAAGTFTTCKFAAAPVRICQKRIAAGKPMRGVIVNSGNANACTGAQGLKDAETMCALTADAVGSANADEFFVSSTGRIGVNMPMDTISAGITKAAAALNYEGGKVAANAIMTTDTVPKSAAVAVPIGGGLVTIGGTTKGAGMIDPQMAALHATMLCYLTTDAEIEADLLNKMLFKAVDASYNRINIDGDMSTNDTTLMFANGFSGLKVESEEEIELFSTALTALCQQLAREMVLDGEGVTKFVTINIKGAESQADAKLCAEAIANSLLCKTAWFGCDPNWGRVVAAIGYSGASFDPDKVTVDYNDKPVVRDGGDAGTPEAVLAQELKAGEFSININLNAGDFDYWVWTNDISYEYVKINAEYHT